MSDSTEEEIIKRRRSTGHSIKKRNLKNLFDDESSTSSIEYIPDDTYQSNLFTELFGTGNEYFYILNQHKQEKKEEKKQEIEKNELIRYMKYNCNYEDIKSICNLYLERYNIYYIFLYKTSNINFYDFLDIYKNITNFTNKSSDRFNREIFNIFFDRLYNGALLLSKEDTLVSISKDKQVVKGVILDYYGNLVDKFSVIDNKLESLIEQIKPKYILVSGYNNTVRGLVQGLIRYKVFYMESQFFNKYNIYDKLIQVGRLGISPEISFIKFYRNIHFNHSYNNSTKDNTRDNYNYNKDIKTDNNKDMKIDTNNNDNDNTNYNNNIDDNNNNINYITNNIDDNNNIYNSSSISYNDVIFKDEYNSEELSNIIKITICAVISVVKIDLNFLLQSTDKLEILQFLGLSNCTRIFENTKYEKEEEIREILKDDILYQNFMTFFVIKNKNPRPPFKGFTDNFVFRELVNVKMNSIEELINKEVEGSVFYVDEYYILVNILNNITCYVRSTEKYYLNQIVRVKITEINEPFLSFTGEISQNTKISYKVIKHPLLYNLNIKEIENKLRDSDNFYLLRQSTRDGKIIIVLKLYEDIIVHIKLEDYDNLDETVNKKVKSILRNVGNIKRHKYFYKTENEAILQINIPSEYIKYGFYFSTEYPGKLCFIFTSQGIKKEYLSIDDSIKYKGKEFKTLEEFVEYKKSL